MEIIGIVIYLFVLLVNTPVGLQRPIWAQLVDDLRPPHRLACDVARQLAAVVAGTGGTDDHLALA